MLTFFGLHTVSSFQMGPVVTIGYVLARDYQIQTQIDNMRKRTKNVRDQNLGTLKATYSDICNIVSLKVLQINAYM